MASDFNSLFIVDGTLDRPLLHSQGLPLLYQLSERGERCFILSFETSLGVKSSQLGLELTEHGITWSPVVIRPGANGLQRLQMIVRGLFQAVELCGREQIKVVHCRSYRPAVIGSLLKLLVGSGFLFDMRGFLLDELVADGRWKAGSLKYRLGKLVERFLVLWADTLTVTSPQFREKVLALPYFPPGRAADVVTIPNCVDTRRYVRVAEDSRAGLRQKLGWTDRFVLVFAGDAFRYRDTLDNIIDYFQAVKQVCPEAFLAMAVNGDPRAIKPERLLALGVENYSLASVLPAEMPEFLAAADLGLAFFKCTNFSIGLTSPVKFAEYLACGLPVITNPGVGDTGRIIKQYRVGMVVDPGDLAALQEGVIQVVDMVQKDLNLPLRCRQAAEEELSLDYAVEEYSQAYVASVQKSRMSKGKRGEQ